MNKHCILSFHNLIKTESKGRLRLQGKEARIIDPIWTGLFADSIGPSSKHPRNYKNKALCTFLETLSMTMDEKYVENIWNLLKEAIQVIFQF